MFSAPDTKLNFRMSIQIHTSLEEKIPDLEDSLCQLEQAAEERMRGFEQISSVMENTTRGDGMNVSSSPKSSPPSPKITLPPEIVEVQKANDATAGHGSAADFAMFDKDENGKLDDQEMKEMRTVRRNQSKLREERRQMQANMLS